MRFKQRLWACALAQSFILPLTVLSAPAFSTDRGVVLAKAPLPEPKEVSQSASAGEVRPVPAGSSLVAPPALLAGKPAWVTVKTPSGRTLSGVSVMVNGQANQTDPIGQASFTVPKADSISLAILDANQRPVDQRKYVTAGGDLLVSATAGE
ncbi:MAG TPA: hypothetical protein V6D08_04325, partial [Candidatus Obscuribacterales bacterium]